MTDPFRTLEDYELFVYTLTERFPTVRHSTLTVVRIGAGLARVAGTLYFEHDIYVTIRKRLLYDRLPLILDWYGYEVWQGKDRLFWYDSQPHPNEPSLQVTHPHHKHIPPDIKHNRVPAFNMSFTRPNLPVLISEIEHLISDQQYS